MVVCETRCNMALIVWTLVANRSRQLMTFSHMSREQRRDARESTDESGWFVIQLAPTCSARCAGTRNGMAACTEGSLVTRGPLCTLAGRALLSRATHGGA